MRPKRKEIHPEPTYSRIGVKVEKYDARVEADINIDAKDPRYAINLDDRDPVYKYITRLTIVGLATYPEDRAGQRFEVTVYGDESPSRRVFATLKDIHERGEYGQPLYRQYRGQDLPVFRKPPGLGLLDKVRGEPRWTAWLNVAARLVSDMLVLLGTKRDLYLAIEERKIGRTRWVDGICLQTTDPAED
jgi:hypothetical protein